MFYSPRPRQTPPAMAPSSRTSLYLMQFPGNMTSTVTLTIDFGKTGLFFMVKISFFFCFFFLMAFLDRQ